MATCQALFRKLRSFDLRLEALFVHASLDHGFPVTGDCGHGQGDFRLSINVKEHGKDCFGIAPGDRAVSLGTISARPRSGAEGVAGQWDRPVRSQRSGIRDQGYDKNSQKQTTKASRWNHVENPLQTRGEQKVAASVTESGVRQTSSVSGGTSSSSRYCGRPLRSPIVVA